MPVFLYYVWLVGSSPHDEIFMPQLTCVPEVKRRQFPPPGDVFLILGLLSRFGAGPVPRQLICGDRFFFSGAIQDILERVARFPAHPGSHETTPGLVVFSHFFTLRPPPRRWALSGAYSSLATSTFL